MRRASSPASTSIRFEWCSRTASAVPPPDAARDTLRGGAIRHALRDAARHVPHDTACHAAHHQLVFIRSHRFTQPGFPTPGPFRSRRRGQDRASHEKSEVRTGEPIGIELPSEDGALAAVFGWGRRQTTGAFVFNPNSKIPELMLKAGDRMILPHAGEDIIWSAPMPGDDARSNHSRRLSRCARPSQSAPVSHSMIHSPTSARRSVFVNPSSSPASRSAVSQSLVPHVPLVKHEVTWRIVECARRVFHRQFHGLDIVTVRAAPSAALTRVGYGTTETPC